jgi:hypothetical protein
MVLIFISFGDDNKTNKIAFVSPRDIALNLFTLLDQSMSFFVAA